MSRFPRLLVARQLERDRNTSALRRSLLQVRNFEGVVAFSQHDLLQNAIQSRPHPAELLTRSGGERHVRGGDELVVLGVVRSCRDWMELKNPRPRMFRSGVLAG